MMMGMMLCLWGCNGNGKGYCWVMGHGMRCFVGSGRHHKLMALVWMWVCNEGGDSGDDNYFIIVVYGSCCCPAGACC